MTFILAEDAALKSYLSGMTVADEKNANRLVKVWFGYPDIEIRTQDFPFVVIELVDVRQAFDRMHSGRTWDVDYRGTVTTSTFATVGSTVLKYAYDYEIPTPYDLVYQLAVYSRHPLHDRSLMFQMMNKFPSKYGHLPVPNALGTETSYRHMFVESFVKRDIADNQTGARRLLNTVYTIRVMSEMTPSVVASATGRVLSVKVNQTPLQYSVPDGSLSV